MSGSHRQRQEAVGGHAEFERGGSGVVRARSRSRQARPARGALYGPGQDHVAGGRAGGDPPTSPDPTPPAGGFDPGGADGLFGPRTRAAIRRWQSSRGARSTGYLDSALAEALRPARGSGPAVESIYRFVLWLVPTVEKFPRHQKFLLGDRLQATALDETGRLIGGLAEAFVVSAAHSWAHGRRSPATRWTRKPRPPLNIRNYRCSRQGAPRRTRPVDPAPRTKGKSKQWTRPPGQ